MVIYTTKIFIFSRDSGTWFSFASWKNLENCTHFSITRMMFSCIFCTSRSHLLFLMRFCSQINFNCPLFIIFSNNYFISRAFIRIGNILLVSVNSPSIFFWYVFFPLGIYFSLIANNNKLFFLDYQKQYFCLIVVWNRLDFHHIKNYGMLSNKLCIVWFTFENFENLGWWIFWERILWDIILRIVFVICSWSHKFVTVLIFSEKGLKKYSKY